MSPEPIVAFNACASGRVQGVGFRYSTRYLAESLGLSGWVRNTDDGNVELFVQGPPERVQDFLQRIQEMPAPARVTNFVTAPAAIRERPDTFDIEY